MHERSDLLLCRVHDRLCGLPIAHVIETMRPLPLEAIAGAPPFVLGLSLIRGFATPVIDVGALLLNQRGQTSGSSNRGRFVTVQSTPRNVALAVDEVLGVINNSGGAHSLELPPVLGPASADVVLAIGNVDAHLLTILRTLRLVPPSVWSAVSAVPS